MTADEQSAVLRLLCDAQKFIEGTYSPDGYNIGVNVGAAGGQSRMHVHVHLIPRYAETSRIPVAALGVCLRGRTILPDGRPYSDARRKAYPGISG